MRCAPLKGQPRVARDHARTRTRPPPCGKECPSWRPRQRERSERRRAEWHGCPFAFVHRRRTRRVCLTARQAICRGLKPVLNDIFKNDSTRVPLWKWVCNPKSCCCAGHTCFYNHHQSLQSLLLACAAAHAREGFSAAMMLRRAAAAAAASSASALASRASSLRSPAGGPLLARRLHDDITSMVGNTPVVRLNRVAPPHVTMYAKCEFMNPVRGSSYGARRKACKLCCLPSPLCTRAHACASLPPRGPHVGSEAKCQLRRQGG